MHSECQGRDREEERESGIEETKANKEANLPVTKEDMVTTPHHVLTTPKEAAELCAEHNDSQRGPGSFPTSLCKEDQEGTDIIEGSTKHLVQAIEAIDANGPRQITTFDLDQGSGANKEEADLEDSFWNRIDDQDHKITFTQIKEWDVCVDECVAAGPSSCESMHDYLKSWHPSAPPELPWPEHHQCPFSVHGWTLGMRQPTAQQVADFKGGATTPEAKKGTGAATSQEVELSSGIFSSEVCSNAANVAIIANGEEETSGKDAIDEDSGCVEEPFLANGEAVIAGRDTSEADAKAFVKDDLEVEYSSPPNNAVPTKQSKKARQKARKIARAAQAAAADQEFAAEIREDKATSTLEVLIYAVKKETSAVHSFRGQGLHSVSKEDIMESGKSIDSLERLSNTLKKEGFSGAELAAATQQLNDLQNELSALREKKRGLETKGIDNQSPNPSEV